jgi:hypothetical protein
MGHRNEILYEAIKEYVRVAVGFVARRVSDQASTDAEREPSAMGDAFFYEHLSSGRDLAELPEYKRCHEALLADPKIAEQLDVLVGAGSRMSRSPTAEQLMRDLLGLGVRHGDYRFDAERFEREYALFEEAFYGDDILYDIMVPLENLLIKGAVRLSDDLEISPLTEEDIDPYGISKVNLDIYGGLRGKPCAVRSKFRAPKVVRRDDEQDVGEVGSAERAEYYSKQLGEFKEYRARQERLNERIEEVVNALRLFGVESVFHVVIIYRASKWFGHDAVFPNPVRGGVPLVYDYDEEWLNMFRQLWQGVQSEGVTRRKYIGLAMRRLGYAHERHRVEDRIIDLLIAAEALFLSDTGGETYRGELQYRLAQRAGVLLGGDPAGRLKVYRHMREAYKLRSKVVHGGNPGQLRLEDGRPVSLEEFVETTKVYLRLALRKIIDLALQSQSSAELVKWDESIFSVGEDTGEVTT